MSVQIAVRLPDDLVDQVDALVREGAGSRAAIVTTALNAYLRRIHAERDAQILRDTGDYDEFDRLADLSAPELDA